MEKFTINAGDETIEISFKEEKKTLAELKETYNVLIDSSDNSNEDIFELLQDIENCINTIDKAPAAKKKK